jgi:DNA-binding CsgD family transcriptional regulator
MREKAIILERSIQTDLVLIEEIYSKIEAIQLDEKAGEESLIVLAYHLHGLYNAFENIFLQYEKTLTLIHANLIGAEFETEQAIGRTFSLEQAVGYVAGLGWQTAVTTKTRKQFGGLTLREREVAALIAQGKSNREIVAELVVGKRTVETHIANILSKLGFTNRAQIVRWALEHGLGKPGE